MSIYTIVIAGVWQSSGFIMAIFLAKNIAIIKPEDCQTPAITIV